MRGVERIPAWLFLLEVVVFGALAIWSATDQNWAGLIAGLVLAAVGRGRVGPPSPTRVNRASEDAGR
jgi:hypothetical protein